MSSVTETAAAAIRNGFKSHWLPERELQLRLRIFELTAEKPRSLEHDATDSEHYEKGYQVSPTTGHDERFIVYTMCDGMEVAPTGHTSRHLPGDRGDGRRPTVDG